MSDIIDCENWPVGVASLGIPDEFIKTWSDRTQDEKNKDEVSPADEGAAGNGTTNDLVALKSADTKQGYAKLQKGKVYNFGTLATVGNDPAFNVTGPGSLKWNSVILGGYDLQLKPTYESLYLTPASWHRAARQGLATSPEYPPYSPSGRSDLVNLYNTVISWRSKLNDNSKPIAQVTAFGANIGVDAQDWILTDCFGQDSAMFCRLSERNTFLGSETAVWAGAPDRAYLIAKNHDWYRNIQPNAWTSGNNDMEAKNPGIGLEIYNFAAYPTTKIEVAYNTFVGRDAGVHFLKGTGNVLTGYQAAQSLFSGSGNSVYGRLASAYLTFGSDNTVIGNSAMQYGAKYNQCVVVGTFAAQSHITGNNGTVMGYSAARNTTNITNAVIIGAYSAMDIANMQSKMFIGNQQTQDIPLIGGDFANRRVGMNVAPGSEKASLHVRNTATSGATGLATVRDGLMIDDNANARLHLATGVGGYGEVVFMVGDTTNKAVISYGESSNTLTFGCGGSHWRITGTGEWRPFAAGKNIGSTGFRVGTIYLQTAPDVSSDERIKQDIRSLDEREKDCALEIKDNIKLYRLIGMEDQRQDCGVIAQTVIAIMTKHGLDWHDYKFVNYAKWDKEVEIDQEGNSVTIIEKGDMYSVNYSSLAMFILSAM